MDQLPDETETSVSGNTTERSAAAVADITAEGAASAASVAQTSAAQTPAAEAPKRRVLRGRKKSATDASAVAADEAVNGATDAAEIPAKKRRRATATAATVNEVIVAEHDTPVEAAAEDSTAKKTTSRRVRKVAPSTQAELAGATEIFAAATPVEVGEIAPSGEPARPAAVVAAEATTAEALVAQALDASAAAKRQTAGTVTKRRSSRTKKTDIESVDAAAEQITDEMSSAVASDSVSDTAPAELKSSSGKRAGGARRATSAAAASTPHAEAAGAAAEEAEETEKPADKVSRSSRNGHNGNGGDETAVRQSRTRQRERKRRSDEGELELAEDDVLLPVAGILDVLDNYAFVRTSGYLPGPADVYVSLGQVKRYGLRRGDSVVGAIRQPREGEGGSRQKYNALVKLDTVNSLPATARDAVAGNPEDPQRAPGNTRPAFDALTPIHPSERLRIESESAPAALRLIDLFAPIAQGQRGMITGPHDSGKSTILHQLAQAITQHHAHVHLMMVLLDERPETTTELARTINGEVLVSTFDRSAEDHTTVAELAVERAKRLVELGHDVVVLIDSLSSLARAYQLSLPHTARGSAGGLDATAVYQVKRLLSAARNIEHGGSLTIIGTVSAQPDSAFDVTMQDELRQVTNMQLCLSGEAAGNRVFPAIDVIRSATRNEQLITNESEMQLLAKLRRAAHGQSALEQIEQLLGRLAKTSTNAEFIAALRRTGV